MGGGPGRGTMRLPGAARVPRVGPGRAGPTSRAGGTRRRGVSDTFLPSRPLNLFEGWDVPGGVAHSFLTILDREVRTRGVRLGLVPFLGAAAVFLAELSDAEPWGPNVDLAFLALGLGLVLGLAVSWWRFRRRRESLRSRWRKWMQWSQSATRLGEVEARVEGSRLPSWGTLRAAAWVVAVLANGAVLVGLWYSWPGVDGVAQAVVFADGLAVGFLAGDAVWGLQWTYRLRGTVREMVEEGELGVWGER